MLVRGFEELLGTGGSGSGGGRGVRVEGGILSLVLPVRLVWVLGHLGKQPAVEPDLVMR